MAWNPGRCICPLLFPPPFAPLIHLRDKANNTLVGTTAESWLPGLFPYKPSSCLHSRTRIRTASGVFYSPPERKPPPSVNLLSPYFLRFTPVSMYSSPLHHQGDEDGNSGVPYSGRLSRFEAKWDLRDPGIGTLAISLSSRGHHWLPRMCLPQEEGAEAPEPRLTLRS